MGRTLDNALLNLGLKDKYKEGVEQLGFSLEDILAQERDAALGNGGLGRLAACYLDSSATTGEDLLFTARLQQFTRLFEFDNRIARLGIWVALPVWHIPTAHLPRRPAT